jgi:hypothetical protein
MEGKMKKIFRGILITIFFLLIVLSYFLYEFCKNNITMIVNIVAVILYSWAIIPTVFFSILSDSEQSKHEIKYYILFHVLYVLLPIALAGQIVMVNQKLFMVVITQVISMCNLVILYVSCKQSIKKHLTYLRYSNMVMSGVFLFVITLICLYNDSLNAVLVFLFLLPLIGLQILYEKVDIFVGEERNLGSE